MKIFENWIKGFFLLLIILITSISIFNFFIDSAGIFGNKSYLSKSATDLVSGKMIAGLTDYDERLFHSLIIKKDKQKVDTIILGSSRAMVTRKKFVVNKKSVFFNHSVSGASLEDYMAVVDLYETKRKYIPKNIIIGIDPWIFNKFNGQLRWSSWKDNYFDILAKVMNKKIDNKFSLNSIKWKQLINYDYTISNIFFLKRNFNRDPYYITSILDIEDSVRDLDASLYYPLSLRNPDSKLVKKRALSFVTKGQVYSLEKFERLDNIDEFEKFIIYLKNRDINVSFALFPYNPITYNLLVKDKDYIIIQEVEEYLKQFARDNKLRVFGSYNPDKFNFKNSDFSDGMHGLEIISKTILQEYKRN